MNCLKCRYWNPGLSCDKFGEIPTHLVIDNPCTDGEVLPDFTQVINKMLPECEKHGLEDVKRYLIAFRSVAAMEPWNQQDLDEGTMWLFSEMKDSYERRALVAGISIEKEFTNNEERRSQNTGTDMPVSQELELDIF